MRDENTTNSKLEGTGKSSSSIENLEKNRSNSYSYGTSTTKPLSSPMSKRRKPLMSKMPVPEVEHHAALDAAYNTRNIFIEKQKQKNKASSLQNMDTSSKDDKHLQQHQHDSPPSPIHHHRNDIKQSIQTIQEMERHFVNELNRLVDPTAQSQYEKFILYDTPSKMRLQRYQTTGEYSSSDGSESSSSSESSIGEIDDASELDDVDDEEYDEEDLLDQKALDRARDLRSQIRAKSGQVSTLRKEQMMKMEQLIQTEIERYSEKTGDLSTQPIDSSFSMWEESAKQLQEEMKQMSSQSPTAHGLQGTEGDMAAEKVKVIREHQQHFEEKIDEMRTSVDRLMHLIDTLQLKVPEKISAFRDTLDTVQTFISRQNNDQMSGTERAIATRVGGNHDACTQVFRTDKNRSIAHDKEPEQNQDWEEETLAADKKFAMFMAS